MKKILKILEGQKTHQIKVSKTFYLLNGYANFS
jgi:hypothetical protein